MKSFHLQSLVFALIIFISVLYAAPSAHKETADSLNSAIENSSVAASANSAVAPVAVKEPAVHVPTVSLQNEGDSVSAGSAPTTVQKTSEAPVALLAEDWNGPVLIDQNSEGRWPIASLTKLMTALVALEDYGPDRLIEVSETAIASEGVAGGFSPGEIFTVSDLIRAMISVSSNDAAAALSEGMGVSEFVARMQQKAQGLGMQNTTFSDATGLSYLDQSTTSDLSILVHYLDRLHPEVLAIATERDNAIKEQRTQTVRHLGNINQFVDDPAFLGGKTGYTDEAKGNLISLFMKDGKKILIIVLGTDDRFGQTRNALTKL